MGDYKGFIRELVLTGSANREDYGVPRRVCDEMVELGQLVDCGGGDYVTGEMADLHLGRGPERDGDPGNAG